MRSGHIHVVIMVTMMMLLSSSKLLHEQTPLASPYATELNFTQTSLQESLNDIVNKLKFVQTTLTQAAPQLTQNLSLVAPFIVGWTS